MFEYKARPLMARVRYLLRVDNMRNTAFQNDLFCMVFFLNRNEEVVTSGHNVMCDLIRNYTNHTCVVLV